MDELNYVWFDYEKLNDFVFEILEDLEGLEFCKSVNNFIKSNDKTIVFFDNKYFVKELYNTYKYELEYFNEEELENGNKIQFKQTTKKSILYYMKINTKQHLIQKQNRENDDFDLF